jgi:hypothetical protein
VGRHERVGSGVAGVREPTISGHRRGLAALLLRIREAAIPVV